MPLQIGNWQLNVNGQPGTLNIASVDAIGKVTGTVAAWGQAPQTALGFWNELAQQLTLWVSVTGLSMSFVFRGCLCTDTMRISGVSGAVLYTLVGIFEMPPGFSISSAHQNVFGWYAQIGVD